MSDFIDFPSLSCIIPTHGRDDLLSEALDAIRAQNQVRGVEIVVVDDMASALTEKLVSEFGDLSNGELRVRYLGMLAEPGRGGASSSRNAGAAIAQGEYLAFLDDDDLWEPDYLVRSLRAIATSQADMAVTWMKVVERDGRVAPLLSIRAGLTAADVVSRNPGVTGSNIVIAKKAYVRLGGFDEGLPVSNDKDFFLRFLLADLLYVPVPHELALHRRHDGEQLTRPNDRRADGLETYLRKHISLTGFADRRFIRQHIHSIRSHTSKSRYKRVLHKVGAVWNYSPADLAAKLLPGSSRTGRYTSV